MAFKYAIALTGGIATGKSSAAAMLSSLGFHIIDADKIAHQILDEQQQAITDNFGKKFVVQGKVDRKSLGAVVFTDSTKRKKLEELLHPLIYKEIKRLSEQADALQKSYFVDIPLFFESERYSMAKSLVVYASKEQQLNRLMSRDGHNEEEALARIHTQISIEEKRKRASYVIDNSGTLAQLQKECERVKEEMLHDSN